MFRRIVLATFLTSLSMFFLQSSVYAQGFNIEFSPAKINLTLEAGKIHKEIFTIGNYSDVDRVFNLYVRDFVVRNEEGGPEFLEDTEQEGSQYSLKNWVTLPFNEVRVAAGDTREVTVTINVPQDAEPGGHYAALFVETDAPSDAPSGSSVGAVGRIASLMLVGVPGDVLEDLNVVEFSTDQKIFYADAPTVEVTTRLENKGSVHGIPTGALFIRGGLSGTNQTVIFNQAQAAVLPGAPARKITETFVLEKNGPIPPMGKFTIELLGRYGTAEQELSATYTFWVIPITFLLASLAVVVVIAFVGWRVFLSFKK